MAQLEAVRMRCVLCYLPFTDAAEVDDAGSHRWLSAWRGLHANAAIRPRGHASALYAHRDCAALISQCLGEPVTYADLWPAVKEAQDATSASACAPPDCLPAHSYQLPGLATGSDVLAFSGAASWALHSPLACTKSAARVLAVWEPRLQCRPSGHRLSFWRQALAARLKQVQVQAGAQQQQQQQQQQQHPAAAPDLLSILIAHPSFHAHTTLAKLQMTSRGTAARIRAVLAGRLRLGLRTCSAEAALSLALWLTRNAKLLAALSVTLDVCCCSEDAQTCQTAMAAAVRAARALNPRMQLVATKGPGKA